MNQEEKAVGLIERPQITPKSTICNRCNGTGKVQISTMTFGGCGIIWVVCPKCHPTTLGK
jgi:DnaJ-class molecular chaperone